MRAQVDSQTAHIGNQSLDESGESSGKKNEKRVNHLWTLCRSRLCPPHQKNKAKQTGGLHVDRSLPVPRQKNI